MPEFPTQPPKPIYEDELLDREALDLDKRISERFSPVVVLALKRICKYIFDIGLPLKEACELSGIEPGSFADLMQTDPDIKRIVYLKELAFKRDMLYVLAKKARAGDEDMAERLLAQKYPDEYGKKKGLGLPNGESTLTAAIEWVRSNGDSSPLVGPNAGRAIIVGTGHQVQAVERLVRDSLS